MIDDIDDLTPEERRLLRSRWLRDASGEALQVGIGCADVALSLLILSAVFVGAVWCALEALR